MRTGIFFQANDGDFGDDVLREVRRNELWGSAYKLGPGWEALDGEEVTFNFTSISHFVIIPHQQSLSARWLPFVAGFGMGGSKTVCLLLREPIDLPNYLRAAHVFHDVGRLISFLKDEANIWDRTYQIEVAREALIALGLGISEENLAERVEIGDEESVDNFLKIGYSADSKNSKGVPLVCIAARNGHRKILEMLVDRGADVNVLSQDRGNSPLMEVAVRGDESGVRKLLQHGADPNLVSKSGQTALMLAIGEGHKGIAKALMDSGADQNKVDSLGMTARKYAQIFRHEEILEILNAAPDAPKEAD